MRPQQQNTTPPWAQALNTAIFNARGQRTLSKEPAPFIESEFRSVLNNFYEKEGGRLTPLMIRTDLVKQSERFHPLFYALWCYSYFKKHDPNVVENNDGTQLSITPAKKTVLIELMKLSDVNDLCCPNLPDQYGNLAYQIVTHGTADLYIEIEKERTPQHFPDGLVSEEFFNRFFQNEHLHISFSDVNSPYNFNDLTSRIFRLARRQSTNLDLFKRILRCFKGLFLDRFVHQWSRTLPATPNASRHLEKTKILLSDFSNLLKNGGCYYSYGSDLTFVTRIIQYVLDHDAENRLNLYKDLVELCKELDTENQTVLTPDFYHSSHYLIIRLYDDLKELGVSHFGPEQQQQLMPFIPHAERHRVFTAPHPARMLPPAADLVAAETAMAPPVAPQPAPVQRHRRQNTPRTATAPPAAPTPQPIPMAPPAPQLLQDENIEELNRLTKKIVPLILYRPKSGYPYYSSWCEKYGANEIIIEHLTMTKNNNTTKMHIVEKAKCYFETHGQTIFNQFKEGYEKVDKDFMLKEITSEVSAEIQSIYEGLLQHHRHYQVFTLLKECIIAPCHHEAGFNYWKFTALLNFLLSDLFDISLELCKGDHLMKPYCTEEEIRDIKGRKMALTGKFDDSPSMQVLRAKGFGHKSIAAPLWNSSPLCHFLFQCDPSALQKKLKDSTPFYDQYGIAEEEMALQIFQYRYLFPAPLEYLKSFCEYLQRRTNNLPALLLEIHCQEDPDVSNTVIATLALWTSDERLKPLQTLAAWQEWLSDAKIACSVGNNFSVEVLNEIECHLLYGAMRFLVNPCDFRPSASGLLEDCINWIAEKIGPMIDVEFNQKTALSEAWKMHHHRLFIKLLSFNANVVNAAFLLNNNAQRTLADMIDYVVEKKDAHLNALLFIQLLETRNVITDGDQHLCRLLVAGIDPKVQAPSQRTASGESITPLMSAALAGKAEFVSLLIYSTGAVADDIRLQIEEKLILYPFIDKATRATVLEALENANQAILTAEYKQELMDTEEDERPEKRKHSPTLFQEPPEKRQHRAENSSSPNTDFSC